jgi:hypothetical protein
MATLLCAAACAVAPAANAACTVVDLETPVERLAALTTDLAPSEQIAAYRRTIVAPNPDLFRAEVLGDFAPGAQDEAMLASLAAVRRAGRGEILREVTTGLAAAERRLRTKLPGFRCDFPIYLMDSLGRFDGAGRQVGGRAALVLGLDQIAAERAVLLLPVFLAHELFHRYHSQASGFSDDPGEHQLLWRSLWAEGLATYASYRLTPGANLRSALIAPPDLAEQARPLARTLASELLGNLDGSDHDVYVTYFTYGNRHVAERGIPWRSGYYLGFLVAQDLGRTRSLSELAALKGPLLAQLIRQALERIAAQGVP